MSASVPITNAHLAAGYLTTQPLGSMAETPPSGASRGIAAGGFSGGTYEHNTSLHVGTAMLFFGGVILALHLGGFRLAFDVGLGRK